MTPVLEVADLSYEYDGGRAVLEDVAFAIGKGERVGIVGANGAGKSTLLWCLLGLHRARGTVRFFGHPLRAVRDRLGVVFQNPEDLLFMPRLIDDLTLPLLNRGAGPAQADARAQAVLELLDLGEYAAAPAGHLSLGQRKRAAIAAALVTEPDLLVFDEPTAELDGRSVRRLAGHLRRLSLTYLITSHDLGFLEQVTDRLLVLAGGRLCADGATQAILSRRDLLEQAALI